MATSPTSKASALRTGRFNGSTKAPPPLPGKIDVFQLVPPTVTRTRSDPNPRRTPPATSRISSDSSSGSVTNTQLSARLASHDHSCPSNTTTTRTPSHRGALLGFAWVTLACMTGMTEGRACVGVWFTAGMDRSRLLHCLDAEVARLRAAAARDLTAPVPTCPEWTVEELVRHVANFYLNVVVRRLHMPEDVPRVKLAPDALAALDRGYNAVVQDLAGRQPDEHVGQMPHETVYYWTRRTTHETAVHRVDAELAVASPVVPMPRDLAIDGIDEMLTGFLSELTGGFLRSSPLT